MVLVRLTTYLQNVNHNNNSLPKLKALQQHSPTLKRLDSRSAGYTGGRVSIQAVSFPGYTGESIVQVRHGESLKEFIPIIVKIQIHSYSSSCEIEDFVGTSLCSKPYNIIIKNENTFQL